VTSAAPAGGVDRTRRMQQLFDAALEIDETRRAAFLAEACGADIALRAEVEALLASLGRAHTRDILPPLLDEGSLSPTEYPETSPSLVGLRIHNYQVDAAIGSGGMAEVYVAHHLVFPRKAALKVLQERFSRSADIVQRFINEARAANAIQHPNIIEVIDAGRLESSGAPYILMEYLDGESLGARLRAGQLPVREAVRIAIETAEAVAAAHDKGIVHRDLKPENIFLVRRDGAPPSVKVLDFGIAKLRSDVANTLAQTQVGMVMGTPQYMSPEQCRDVSTVDHRADIYSLGVILYEMVCGRPPFQSAAGFADLVYAHVAVVPESPRKLTPSLPISLESVILRCLAKSPDDRYASMRDLVDGLHSALLREQDGPSAMAVAAPVTQVPPTTPRSRRWVIATVFSLAALAGAAVALRGRHFGAPATRPEAVPVVGSNAARMRQGPTPPSGPARDDREAPAAAPTSVPTARPSKTVEGPAPTPATTTARAKRHERRDDAPPVVRKETPGVVGRDVPESLRTNPY
jgi:hypothetical protein